jgi:hypothetical protein
MMTDTETRIYDDELLRKKRGIKVANAVVSILFFTCLVPLIVFAPVTARRDRALDVLIAAVIFMLIAYINILHLRHIASITLYRKQKDDSQPTAAATPTVDKQKTDGPSRRGRKVAFGEKQLWNLMPQRSRRAANI